MKTVTLIFGTFGTALAVAILMALPTMWLWNYLMPDLFSTPEIGFLQALALNTMSSILFKSQGNK